jgi:hypothetical protein
MSRRHVVLIEAERTLLHHIFTATAPERAAAGIG